VAGVDRPAVTAGVTSAGQGREAVAAVWRIESARIVGALTRLTGDFTLAEDLAQEAWRRRW
jgi:predicted RNA polymerase sigma factor